MNKIKKTYLTNLPAGEIEFEEAMLILSDKILNVLKVIADNQTGEKT